MTDKPGPVAIARFDCPTCKAIKDARCVTASGKATTPHIQRWRLAEGWIDGAAPRDAEVADLRAKYEAADAVNEALRDDLDAARDDAERLSIDLREARAEYDAHMAGHVPGPPALLLGMAYKGNVDPAPVEARIGGKVGSRRTYYGASEAEIRKAEAHVKANIAAGRRVSSLSFKLPHSWADMAAGKGDAWATNLRDRLAKLTAGTGHLIRIAFHHEPEDDTKDDPTTAEINEMVVARDQWKLMQLRLAPIFDRPGFEFIVILMGYHSLNAASSIYKIWRLDLAVPIHPAIKGVGYDLYETRGVVREDKSVDGWRDFRKDYLPKIRAFHAAHPGLAWGFSEYSHTATAATERPTLLADMTALLREFGASWLEWFNSNLNSVAGWEMEPDSIRERAFGAALKSTR